LATGSLPAENGYQRALPTRERLPGLERGNVWSVNDVMGRRAKLGKRVLVVDDVGHWHGLGTAWHLAENGHKVVVVTGDNVIGRGLVRTTADVPLRAKLQQLGCETMTEVAVTEWDGDNAILRNMLSGVETNRPFDSLVLATLNIANSTLADELEKTAKVFHAIGDCVAPRHAPAAIYEGRKLGLSI
jgi:pyruvate/2-oxoglutarate dehydrogenase complex dihydrolipoamide dehydrogenase (E3) component